MHAQVKAFWLRNSRAGLFILLAVLFFAPGIARAQAGRRPLVMPLQQESTSTLTPTTTPTLTVTPGNQTATLTATGTPTVTGTPPTATATAGNQTATASPTAGTATAGTATATNTASPTAPLGITSSPTTSLPTQTPPPSLTATSAFTQVLTVTATLAPFPTLTFIYPDFSATPELLSEPRLPGNPALSKPTARLDWARLLVCGFVLLLWIALVVWFVFSQRRVG